MMETDTEAHLYTVDLIRGHNCVKLYETGLVFVFGQNPQPPVVARNKFMAMYAFGTTKVDA